MRRFFKVILVCFVAAALVALVLCMPNQDGRDWAEVKVQSVNVSSNGYVTLQLRTHYSSGAGIERTEYNDGVVSYVHREGGGRRSFFPFNYGASAIGFNANPEQAVIQGAITNSPSFARLLVHEGETRRIHAGETLSLYDFTSKCALALNENHQFSCVYRVIPRKKPGKNQR